MKNKIRNWNWIPKGVSKILEYFDSLTKDTFIVLLYFKEFNIYIKISLDDKNMYQLTTIEYKGRIVNKIPQNKSLISLIYLSKTDSYKNSIIHTADNLLLKTKDRTDVLFDPINNLALIHGPTKFGFIKSLVLGLISFYLIQKNYFGLHSSLTVSDGKGIFFCGVHGMGKTSLSLANLLLDDHAQLISDDWAFYFNKIDTELSAMTIEKYAFVNTETLSNLIKYIPYDKINNIDIYNFIHKQLNAKSYPELLLKTDSRFNIDIDALNFKSNRVQSNFNVHKVVCIIDLPNEQPIIRKPKEFIIDTLFYSSYHIPFHSPISYQNLIERKYMNFDEKFIYDYALESINKEKRFWGKTISILDSLIINRHYFNIIDIINLLINLK